MAPHFDVIIQIDSGNPPVAKLVTGGREWFEGWPVQLGKQRGAAAFPLAEGALVEFLQ